MARDARRGTVKPKNGAKTEAQRQAFRNYHNAKVAESFRKPKPPKDSWWARPVPQQEFYATAAKQYDERMKGFGITADTF